MCLLPGSIKRAGAQVNVYTRSYDTNRSGANLQETILTPANVSATTFGKLFTVHTDGQIYAQPLYVSNLSIAGGKHNVVFVATMLDSIYAIDADTGTQLWTQNYGTPITPQEVETDQNISWNTGIGILSTPVIDPTTNIMYFVSANESKSTSGDNVYQNILNAIDITTGHPVLGGPVTITATYSTADLMTPLVFDAKIHNQRPGLALANGNVYIAWASHEDKGAYHGWVMAYSASTLAQTAVYSDTTSGRQGGIWTSGQAPTVDTHGNIYISTGNGSFGKTVNALVQTGNSFIKLSPQLQLLDYFTPTNSTTLNAGDQDLGSSGLLLIPNTNYILGGGKQGILYLVNTNGMGEFNSSTDQVQQEFQAVTGKGTSHIHGGPVFYNSAANGPMTYVWGENDVLRAYPFNEVSSLINTTPLATSTMTAPATNNNGAMPGGFLAISANGNTNGIVWAATPYNGDATHAPVQGVLYAFNADTLQLLWSDKMQDTRDEVGMFAKYCPPVVANGKMYIPNWGAIKNADGSGNLVAYGLLSTAPPPLPQLTVAIQNASMTSGAALPTFTSTVTGLTNGDTVGGTIQIAYSTTATSSSPAGTYSITATVTGTSASHYKVVVTPGTLTITPSSPTGGGFTFPSGFSGASLLLNGNAALSGTHLRLTDGKNTEASSAYYPSPVNVQSFSNDFTFQLSSAHADGMTMVIQNAGANALGASGAALGYGAGAQAGIGKSLAIKFDFYNNSGEGNDSTGLFVNGATPTVPSTDLKSTGLVLSNGDVMQVHATYDGTLLTVVITDTQNGKTATQSYPIDIPSTVGDNTAYIGFTAGTGGQSAVQDILTWTYTPAPASTALPDFANGFTPGLMTLNGGAALNGTRLRLLDGKTDEARSAFFPTVVNVQQFQTTFTFQMTSPTGDGIAFVLQAQGPTALGGYGGALGYGPQQAGETAPMPNSAAIKFDLYSNAGEGQNSTGLYLNGVTPTIPSIDLTPSGVNLHSGNVFSAALNYDGTTLTVVLTDTVTEATATQTYAVNLPDILGSSGGYAGFTGGTGGSTVTADILTWTYALGSSAPPSTVPIVYNTVSLPAVSSGPTLRTFTWTGFPAGTGTILDATKAGDNVAFTVNVANAGTYAVSVNSKQLNTRGIFQLTVDGIPASTSGDEYNSNGNGVLGNLNLGTFTMTTGSHTFLFTVTGKDAVSAGYSISFGQLTLTPK
jgi:Legume lectin domain/MBG domain (YGX type)